MELTIEITQFCENNCDYCSSLATEEGKHLDLQTIKDFLKNKESEDIHRINISGGEPLAHPNFYQIYKLCKEITNDVRVYTNLIEHIIFNAHVISEIKVESNFLVLPGRQVTIPTASKIHFLQLQHCGGAKGFTDKTEISCSGSNCLKCNHSLLQADGKIMRAPCGKHYE